MIHEFLMFQKIMDVSDIFAMFVSAKKTTIWKRPGDGSVKRTR